jgi:hypothetical protein
LISGFGLAALVEPEAFAVHFQDINVVCQSVEDGAGDSRFVRSIA